MAATTPSSTEAQEAKHSLSRLTRSPPLFTFWSPPEDSDKPSLPYIPGFTVQVRRHVPPRPFGGRDYGMGTREELSESYLREITQSELVVDHPSADTPLSSQSQTSQLTIMAPIAIGGVRGAQIVSCEIAPRSENVQPWEAVAKIYDPMYYNFERNSSHQPQDTVWQADSDYSREAAAYEHLQKKATAFAPEYFGSWTFDLPIKSRGVHRYRPVRMILIERLGGMSMRSMRVRNDPDPEQSDDAFHYPEEYRLEVLAIAMDQYVRMLHSGLDQRDFASRNIMLVASTKPAVEVPAISGLPLPRILLVDYNRSVVRGLTTQASHLELGKLLPPNPMQLWWGIPMNEFVGWVPHEWHSTPSLKREWLRKRFGGIKHAKLYTMDREPELDSGEASSILDSNISAHRAASSKPTAGSKNHSKASGSHDGKEQPNDPPILMRYLPWNPKSDEMKRRKALLEKQGKLTSEV